MLELLVQLAWPIVALFALISVWILFGRDAKKLPTAIADIRKLVNDLPAVQDLATQLKEIKSEMESINKNVGLFGNKISDLSKLTAQESVERAAEIIDTVASASVHYESIESEAESNSLTPKQMFEAAMKRWDQFSELFQKRLKEAGINNFDLRSYRDSAKKLTDKRRKKILLNDDDVNLIGQLHGQFKRFTRMQSSVNDWMTSKIYAQFVAVLDEANKKLLNDDE